MALPVVCRELHPQSGEFLVTTPVYVSIFRQPDLFPRFAPQQNSVAPPEFWGLRKYKWVFYLNVFYGDKRFLEQCCGHAKRMERKIDSHYCTSLFILNTTSSFLCAKIHALVSQIPLVSLSLAGARCEEIGWYGSCWAIHQTCKVLGQLEQREDGE